MTDHPFVFVGCPESNPSLNIVYMKELYMFPPLHPWFPSGTKKKKNNKNT